MLLAARAVQGAGGALVAPAGLGLILATHHHPTSRGKALSQYTAAASVAAVAGVILGGILTEEASWRWVMFVNVPFGCLLVLAVAVSLAPAGGYQRGPLDVAGAATVTVGVSSLTYGVSQATTDGWGSAGVVVALIVAAGLIAGFLFIESRATQPLIRLSVFRIRNLDIGNVVVACFGVCLTGSTFFLSLIFQSTLGYSALRTGAAMVPLGAAMAVSSIGSARLVLSLGARHVLVAGAAISAAGFVWFAALPDQPHYAEDLLVPMFVIGTGLGLMMMPCARAATSGIPPHEAGLASGLLSMSRQLGAAVGLAALVTLASSLTRHRLAGHTAKAAELHGFRGALLGTAAFGALAAVTALFLRGEPDAYDIASTPAIGEF
jgi:EmrB/QacA subfamily drug resistance transporter